MGKVQKKKFVENKKDQTIKYLIPISEDVIPGGSIIFETLVDFDMSTLHMKDFTTMQISNGTLKTSVELIYDHEQKKLVKKKKTYFNKPLFFNVNMDDSDSEE